MAFDIPHSCTLPTSERPLRLAEFDVLLQEAISATRDSPSSLAFTFKESAGLEARVRDLTERESSCCSFFEFDVAASNGYVVLGIRVPERHSDILDSLQTKSGLQS